MQPKEEVMMQVSYTFPSHIFATGQPRAGVCFLYYRDRIGSQDTLS